MERIFFLNGTKAEISQPAKRGTPNGHDVRLKRFQHRKMHYPSLYASITSNQIDRPETMTSRGYNAYFVKIRLKWYPVTSPHKHGLRAEYLKVTGICRKF